MFAPDLYEDFMSNAPPFVDLTMIERGLVKADSELRILTSFGLSVSLQGGWKNYLNEKRQKEKVDKESQMELQYLTKKQLQLSIREMQVSFTQIKYWFLILIITIVTSAILGAWLQYLFRV